MEPEEIDKLFKNRLNGLPVPPSPDAWMRLQAKMEPPKKERTMWLYYAAASVIILLVSGLLLFRSYNPEAPETIAQTEMKKPAEKISENIPTTQATTDEPIASTEETIASAEKETAVMPQPVSGQKDFAAAVKLAGTKENKKVNKPRQVIKAATPVEPAVDKTEVFITQNKDTRPADDRNTIAAANPATPGVVQVLVKMDDTAERAEADLDEMNLRENISRKGMLLKNIEKQARNLKNGEPVELATLGLDTEKINAEKENIKQKINKVISL